MSLAQLKTIALPKSGIQVFYREHSAASTTKTILLLHGFPSSSHQYRNLAQLLAARYRVIAPDLPGFGFTEVPSGTNYTFELLATTLTEFVDALALSKFAMYIFDYGAPTGLRFALQQPDAIEAIISQNGNAYVEGLGDAWAPIREFWASPNGHDDRKKIEDAVLTFETTRWQYTHGTPEGIAIAPESYTLDYALMERSGNKDIQLDLFFDYQNNVKLYDQFQEYFRKSQVPLLAIWGDKDLFFIPPGAQAFKRDLPNAVVKLIDAGHFAAETHTEVIAQEIVEFLG
jgi:pimeloyl-ACP methyl ester carboxylesterase